MFLVFKVRCSTTAFVSSYIPYTHLTRYDVPSNQENPMNALTRRFIYSIASFLFLFSISAAAQLQAAAPPAEDYVKAHYTKYEFRIPMRDGKRLFTSVYAPKDSSQAWPIMMDRTPYSVSPYGEDQYKRTLGPSDEFEKAGYIFVYQDVRGRYMSEGDFVEMHPHIDVKKSAKDVDDSSDTFDTIEFLLKHIANNNG